jgi:chromosome partitioning protein
VAVVYEDDLTEVSQRTNDIVQFVQENVLLPSMEKEPIRYLIGDAADMVGKSQQSLKNNDDIGRPQKTPYGTVERREYFIDDINRLRDHFKTRKTFKRSIILAVGSYKGGVSKSTCTQHIAHYFATQGYRVLVVDTDPQASTTQQLLGVVPDIAIAPEQTLAPLLKGDSSTIDPDTQIVKTNWPSVDIVPAQMALLDAEGIARFDNIKLDVFAEPLMDVAHDYDLVVIDTPPSSSYLTISSFVTCDVLLVPSPPRWMDLCSTASFFNLCRHHLVGRLEYRDLIVRIVPSLVHRAPSKNKQKEDDSVERSIMKYMRVGLGPWMLDCELLHSSTTQSLASSYRTLY